MPLTFPPTTNDNTKLIRSLMTGKSGAESHSAPNIFNAYGMSPDAVNKQFGNDYATATGGYAPFEGAGARAGISRLEGEYGKVGSTFDVSKTISALEKARNVNLQVGGQAANNASSKYSEEFGPGGANAIGASMVRAKSLLPFLQADYAGAAEEGKYRDSAKEKALAAGADIANSLARLELEYTNSLANYNAGKANFGLNFASNKTGLALDASKMNSANAIASAQLMEQARQADLRAAMGMPEEKDPMDDYLSTLMGLNARNSVSPISGGVGRPANTSKFSGQMSTTPGAGGGAPMMTPEYAGWLKSVNRPNQYGYTGY